jgi:hypothetical protein
MIPSPIPVGVGNGAHARPALTTPAQGVAPPAQGQTPRAGQAELVICDQTIEAMFSDFKSRGFGLEDSQIRHADRLARLLLVMALALHWAVSAGMWDAAVHPVPAEKN